MGNAPVAQVDAMVIEQAVLTRNLQMVASAQGVLKIFRLILLFGIPQLFREFEFLGCDLFKGNAYVPLLNLIQGQTLCS